MNTFGLIDSSAGEGLTFVVFVVERATPSSAGGAYELVHDGRRLLRLLRDSVRRTYPASEFVVLTSPQTDADPQLLDVRRVVRSVGSGPLLYERMKAYQAFLESAVDDRAYVFVESDMLILRRIKIDAERDWDIALLSKPKFMWINSGVVMVRAGRRARAAAFLRRAAAIYEERYLDHPEWGSDQLALRDAAGLESPPVSPMVREMPEAQVLLLPLTTVAPFTRDGAPGLLDPPATPIIYFTGARKRRMGAFYRLHIGGGVVGRSTLAVLRGVRRFVHVGRGIRTYLRAYAPSLRLY